MARTDLQSLKAKYSIIGSDQKLNNALDTALQVARTDLSVLVQGESGVGKEVLPRIIHDASLRRSKRYIAINCGSIPEGTIDSELFGHVKGSFTGAIDDREGYFGAADGGTLFLDEVGELPLQTQVRLLRVLETGEYVRVGSSEVRKTNVRIVAATNVNMQRAIADGRFREDLYYRLCTISIKMPPLRERGDDVVRLFKHFAMETARKYQIPQPVRLTPEAEAVVMSYRWPGNIRQLKNIAEQLSILCEDSSITPEVLAAHDIVPGGESMEIVTQQSHDGKGAEAMQQALQMVWTTIASLKQDVEMIKQHIGLSHMEEQPAQHMLPHHQLPQSVSTPPLEVHAPVDASQTIDYPDVFDAEEVFDEDDNLNLEKMERKMIEAALQRHRNRRKLAADELGISERTLYRKIKDYGLEE